MYLGNGAAVDTYGSFYYPEDTLSAIGGSQHAQLVKERRRSMIRKIFVQTPLQKWATQRWAFKGAVTAAIAMINYHKKNTELALTERRAIREIENRLRFILFNYEQSQALTKERVRRKYGKKTRKTGRHAVSARQPGKGRAARI